nr:MAG TPA: hypothetical protein [Caudoviricetes sp.]
MVLKVESSKLKVQGCRRFRAADFAFPLNVEPLEDLWI